MVVTSNHKGEHMARRGKLPGLLAACVLLSVMSAGQSDAEADNWRSTFTLTYEPTGKPGLEKKSDMGQIITGSRYRLDSKGDCGNALKGVKVNARFCFDSKDPSRNVWTPQGVSHVSDAYDAEAWTDPAHRVWQPLLVSWYLGKGESTRSRITVIAPREAGKDPVYDHVELVRGSNAANVPTHAGGIAWYGQYLYVAETYVGIHVFDLTDIRVKDNGGYVLPEIGVWRADDTGGTTGVCTGTNPQPRFSSMSVVRASHRILVSEFCGDEKTHTAKGRVVSYQADGKVLGRLEAGAKAKPVAALNLPKQHIQGVASDGRWFYLNQSYGRSGKIRMMHRAKPSGANLKVTNSVTGAVGGEDLSLQRHRSLLWSVTEFPSSRVIYNVRTGSL